MSLDLADDAGLADNTEAVTVTTKRADGDTEIAVSHALRRVLDRRQQFYGGVALQGDELIWNIPNEELGGADLRRGDTITDAEGVVWTILFCSKQTLGSRWRALCRSER